MNIRYPKGGRKGYGREKKKGVGGITVDKEPEKNASLLTVKTHKAVVFQILEV